MPDNRFTSPGVDTRFPSPGTDTRFSAPGTDNRFPSPGSDARFEDLAGFSTALTGLSSDSLGSYARIGNEAGISYSITPDNGTDTVAWDDNNPNSGSDYGTGANPTSLAALSGATLYCHVTDGGDTVTKSVGVRYAPGSAAGALPDQNGWQVGVAITTVDPTGDFTLTDLTGTWSATGLPAGVSINSGTGAITGTPTGTGSGSITITFTDQYGRTVNSGFSYAVAAGNVAPVINGVPTIPASAAEGNVLTATAAPLSAGSPTPTRTWQWLRDGVAISGATSDTYTVVAADVGTQLSVRQTETNVVDFDSATSAQTSAVTGQQITLTNVSFNGSDTISATVNRTGTFYWMISNNPTETAAAIIAGGGLDSGSFALISGTNNGSVAYPNTPAGLHYLHCVADAGTSPSPSAVNSTQYNFPSGDTTAPVINGGSPGDDATDVAVDANPTVVFSEDVQFATTGTIIIYDVTGATNFEVFDVATDVGSGPGSVSISGDTLTIEPTSDFANSNDYAIRFSGNPIEDLAGNDLVDVSDSTTYNFTTVAAGGATPTYVSAGTGQGSGGAMTVPWGPHSTGDFGILFVEQRGNDTTPATPSGWTLFGTASTGSGSSDTKVTAFTRQAVSASEADVSLADNGNHQNARIYVFGGATAAVLLGSVSTGSGTAVTLTSGTTGGANRLIVGVVCNPTDVDTDEISAWTNGNLTSLTDRGGQQSSAVAGGGFDVFTGERAAAGAVGSTTATLATSAAWAGMVMELAA